MSVRIEGDRAVLDGVCGIEAAELLTAACHANRPQAADLSGCRELHGAVVQALLGFGIPVVGAPEDPFVRDFVAPALERARAQSDKGRRDGSPGLVQ